MISVSTGELREKLAAALGAQRWVDEVAGLSPFKTLEDLVEAGRRAAAELTPEEIDEALAHHPRIGDRPVGSGLASVLSRREQAGALGRPDAAPHVVDTTIDERAEQETDAALARDNRIYESRFGRVFLVRAAGRTREEIVEELQRRLKLDDETELEEVGRQLWQIAELRLRTLFSSENTREETS